MASCVFAAIPDSEFAIGGITIGSSADYVQSIYGEPTHISDKVPNAEGGYSYSYAYGSSFYIFFDANTNVMTGIFSTAKHAWEHCGIRSLILIRRFFPAKLTPKISQQSA